MTARLCEIRACLEGGIPAAVATCAADGTPNVVYTSQVHWVDGEHVALSFQFFNKTRRNILSNPYAAVLLLDPRTAASWRLHLKYLRTETEGPLFESMKAQLAGIASHSGMQDVFRLQGSDIYAVERIDAVPGEPLPLPAPRVGMLPAVRRCAERLARCHALDEALNVVIDTLVKALGIEHTMLLMLDESGQGLYTVASAGYARSGVGSEIPVGQGVIGVAARERTPVRIGYMTHAAIYSQALRSAAPADVSTEIPYPGLAQPNSQLAVPIVSTGRVLGVLFVESEEELRFDYEDEDVLVALAAHLGAVIDLMRQHDDVPRDGEAAHAPALPSTARESTGALHVRHYRANDSIFVGDDYLIKGVAGAILWKLLREHANKGRTEFTNRELRLDAGLGLPEVGDNLEARLVLLRRRLEEHGCGLRIEKTGRGRFRMAVNRAVVLADA